MAAIRRDMVKRKSELEDAGLLFIEVTRGLGQLPRRQPAIVDAMNHLREGRSCRRGRFARAAPACAGRGPDELGDHCLSHRSPWLRPCLRRTGLACPPAARPPTSTSHRSCHASLGTPAYHAGLIASSASVRRVHLQCGPATACPLKVSARHGGAPTTAAQRRLVRSAPACWRYRPLRPRYQQATFSW